MAVPYQAIILSGGRSSRLGGSPKALLAKDGQTLLGRALASCAQAQPLLVVGPSTLPLPAGVLLTRENPPYSGPASAISAGLTALASHPQAAPWTLLLSCDLTAPAPAVQALTQAASTAPPSVLGYQGTADGVPQPLLGIYRTDPLTQAFTGPTINAPVRRFLSPLNPRPLPLPPGSAQDIDTWDQAHAQGYTPSHQPH